MRRPTFFAAACAIVCTAVLTGLVRPGGRIGRRADEAGAVFAYGHRRPANAGNIVLVEIDDASVAQLGEWPWKAETIRKVFEAPFASAETVVAAVSPGDFEFAPESGEAFWGALENFRSVGVMTPFSPGQLDVGIAAVLSPHPSGGQGELLRASGLNYDVIAKGLPEWREQAIRGAAYSYARRYPEAGMKEFKERALGPYWLKSGEVERLVEFWFAQAKAAETAARTAEVEGFDKAFFPRLAEVDYAYFQPAKAGVGFTGNVGGGDWAREAAVVSFRDRPILRIGAAAGKTMRSKVEVKFEGRTLVASGRQEGPVRIELGEDGTFLPDWTGNAKRAWEGRFRRFSAGSLVEAANARRAVWGGYAKYEASTGGSAFSTAAGEYERAASRTDVGGMNAARRRIAGLIRELDKTLGLDRDAEEEQITGLRSMYSGSEYAREIVGLEFDYQVLSSAIEDAFGGSIVMIVPTAEQYRKVKAPWGERVPAAAADVMILNSILTGQTIRAAPDGTWLLAAIAGGIAATFVAARLGGVRAAVPFAVIAVGGFAWWFSLLSDKRILLGASCLLVMPLGYIAGAAAYAMTAGRRRRSLRRVIKEHVSPEALGGIVRRGGKEALRVVDGAGVVAMGFDAVEQTVRASDRCVRAAREAILAVEGVALEGGSEVEGAFGWLGKGEALESAISAALSARQRLRLISEKAVAEGEGRMEMRAGVAGGEGRLGSGRISRWTLVGSGKAFEKARGAAAAARRWRAGIVVPAKDAEAAGAAHELRRLDAEGRFYEVLERKGALSVTMKKVRENYERALEEIEKGRSEEAKKLLAENIENIEDGPSKTLLEEIFG